MMPMTYVRSSAAMLVGMVPVVLCAVAFSCNDPPGLDPAAATPCAPLSDPGVHVTSEALTKDGHYVVVLGSGSTARVFYGISVHLVEGTITKMQSSCVTEIDFVVQGRSYVATLSTSPTQCMTDSKLVALDPEAPPVEMPLTVLELSGALVDAGAPLDGGVLPVSAASLVFFCS
jgi:hypothetical protein